MYLVYSLYVHSLQIPPNKENPMYHKKIFQPMDVRMVKYHWKIRKKEQEIDMILPIITDNIWKTMIRQHRNRIL